MAHTESLAIESILIKWKRPILLDWVNEYANNDYIWLELCWLFWIPYEKSTTSSHDSPLVNENGMTKFVRQCWLDSSGFVQWFSRRLAIAEYSRRVSVNRSENDVECEPHIICERNVVYPKRWMNCWHWTEPRYQWNKIATCLFLDRELIRWSSTRLVRMLTSSLYTIHFWRILFAIRLVCCLFRHGYLHWVLPIE